MRVYFAGGDHDKGDSTPLAQTPDVHYASILYPSFSFIDRHTTLNIPKKPSTVILRMLENLLTMDQRRPPEFIIEVFADPSSVKDVVRGI